MDSLIPVDLYMYDLSGGLAPVLSQGLLGRHIEAVWHTSIVVYDREYFFGNGGVQNIIPGTVVIRQKKVERLGFTSIPQDIFHDYLDELKERRYSGTEYHLLHHNCNTFSDEIANFLVGKGIPDHILSIQRAVATEPWAEAIRNLINFTPVLTNSIPFNNRNSSRDSPEHSRFNTDNKGSGMADTASEALNGGARDGTESPPPEARKDNLLVSVLEEQEKREKEERREREEQKRLRDPPIVFRDTVDPRLELDGLLNLLDGKLSPDEQQSLEELHMYMLEDENSLALGDGFLNFVGRLLHDKSLPNEVRVHILRILAAAALKDDAIILLHQDRREHVLMNYAFDVDRVSPEEQKALALFVCNLFENLSSSEWLLYISDWQYCNATISNIRVTTKVSVNSLLSDVPELQDLGTAIIHNLACKEVFDDVAVEITMALLQFFNNSPNEEHLFRAMKSLGKFCLIAPVDVPQLVQMIGPDPKSFRGKSKRIDEHIDIICSKMR